MNQLKIENATVKYIEQFVGKSMKEAIPGDYPGILLDIDKDKVKRGDIMIGRVEDHEK